MKDTQTITIVLLAVTAILLGTVLVATMPETAKASDSARQGGYLITSVRTNNSRELVYVTNIGQQRVIAYGLDTSKNEIVPIAALDLREAFGGAVVGKQP